MVILCREYAVVVVVWKQNSNLVSCREKNIGGEIGVYDMDGKMIRSKYMCTQLDIDVCHICVCEKQSQCDNNCKHTGRFWFGLSMMMILWFRIINPYINSPNHLAMVPTYYWSGQYVETVITPQWLEVCGLCRKHDRFDKCLGNILTLSSFEQLQWKGSMFKTTHGVVVRIQ